MTLMRGYTRLQQHGPGQKKLPVSCNLRMQAGLVPGADIAYQLVRLKGTAQRAHVLFHRPDCSPRISSLELVLRHGLTQLGEDGAIALPDAVAQEIAPDDEDLLELKIIGPRKEQWLVAYNRGPRYIRAQPSKFRRQTADEGTVKAVEEKQWHRVSLEY